MRRWHKFALAGVVAAPLALGAAAKALGLYWNTSPSIPLGLYRATSELVRVGSYVLLCLPQGGVFEQAYRRGYLGVGVCPGGAGYVMKRVMAAHGDHVELDDDGVRVNGQPLPDSAPVRFDGAGRLMPHLQATSATLAPDQVLLMSDRFALSFDARYFGPTSRRQIKTVIRPVFTY
ncbi:conjugative transfer signal peptidase TraF [uncultured Azohydromonas sp.]|jgi:conjugative transfer signal peptidase TraF|uniref:conjugative transfer signal peptidase TraF n=1 Tax=uncultured Azohydromonas sp. TaxID=487342 RepID=UPI002632CE86|nr:conjugative transfer signal peptidase TraF [uncultured Azohydromonas sp.]